MTRIESIKTHLRNNKVTYIACGVTAVVVAGVTYYVVRNSNVVKAVAAATTEYVGDTVVHNAPTMNNTICWKPTMQNIVNFAEDSTPSRPVGLLGKDGGIKMAFKSMNEAARQTGHNVGMISKNVNGHLSDLNGDRFVALADLIQDAA